MKKVLNVLFVLGIIHLIAVSALGGLIGNDVLLATGGRFPDVAYNSTNGSYLVVWADYSQNPVRTAGRRVDSGGATIGSQFYINDAVSYGLMPAIAYNATDNEWLVTWDDGRGGADHVYGQRVRGSDGVLLGGNIAIGSIAGAVRSAPAWSPTYNSYLVVFSGFVEVHGQRVSNTGTLLGSNFNISNDTVFSALPAIAGNGSQYLVTWDHNPSGNLGYIRACLVDASNGALIGSPFNVSSTGADDRSCIAYDSVNGRYLVQWNQQGGGYSYDQYAQFVSTSGTLIGSSIPILHTTDFEGDTQFGGDICFLPGVNRFFSQGANVGSFAGYAGIEFNNATGAVVGYKNILGLGDLMSGNCAADTTLNRYLSCWDGAGVRVQLYGSSATAVPGTPGSPNPANGTIGANISSSLSWAAGSGATSHNVYFGTTNPPPYVTTTSSASYAPTLAWDTTYYWRINEVNAGGTTQGSVWSFDTKSTVSINLGNTNIEDMMTSPIGGDGDTIGATGIAGRECRRNMDPSFNDWYFYFTVGDGWAYQGSKTDVWIAVDYYDDTATGSFTLNYDATSGAYKDGGSILFTGTNTWKTHKFHITDAYFGNRENNGSDFRIYVGNVVHYLDTLNVQQKTPGTVPPGQASNPNPANAATGVDINADLSWTAGSGATAHNVYFGTSNPPPLIGVQTGTTYDPGTLALATTYYWRIDEYTSGGGTTSGNVWSFTTSSQITLSNSTFASSADGWTTGVWHSGSLADGTMAFDSGTGNPAGGMKSTGAGITNNTDSCTREGGEIKKLISTAGYSSIQVKYDLRYATDQTGSTCTGSCTANVLEGDCADKLAVYYSTAGTNGPWTLLEQVTAASLTQNTWFNRTINLPAGANNQSNFSLRYKFQFNTDTDSAWLDNIKVSGSPGSPPGQASNPNPANAATNVDINTDLSWTADVGATSHDVRFGTANPPPFVINQTSTTYDPGAMSAGTTYYWRIDEVNGSGTTTGTVWSFTTLGLPSAASNPNPANGATGVNINADLSWTAGAGATSHNVRFGTANPPPFVINQAGTTYDAGTMSAGTTYYWRIDEINSSGTTTGTVWSFTTLPLPGAASAPSPANGTTLVNINADLSWTAGSNAASHDVRFGTANPPPFVVNQAGTTYDPGAMSAGTVYYWRIDEVNTSGTTTGTVWSFTTLPLPGAASSPSPANGATLVNINADLSWTAGSNAASHDVRFGTVNPPPFVVNQTGTTYDPGAMTAGIVYYWRIDEVNSSGTTTGTVWSFTTLPLPGAASAPNPANGATLVNINADLSWTAGSNAASRDVRFGTANPPPFVVNQTATTYDPGAMTAGTTYYWRIDEVNSSGTTTGTVWSFSTLPLPGAASSPSPANGATLVVITADLIWTAGSNAASHDVRFGTANPPPFVVNQTGTTYDPGTLSPNTIYYWRIDEVNSSGTTTGTVWSFTTLPLPGLASLPSPLSGATGISITTTVSWTTGLNAASHDVRFGTANPPPFVVNQASTTYNPGTLNPTTTYFWRIDEVNTSGTTTGTVWSFTTATPPNAPTVTAPSNGSTVTTLTPTITWTGDAHDQYQVRVSQQNDSNTSTNGYDSGTVTSTGGSQVSGTLRNYSFYYVFVRLHNIGGWGAWSAAGYNFIVNTDSTNGTVYLGNALLSASGWAVYDGTCENGCTGITTSIVSDGGSNVEKLIDASTANRSKMKYAPGNVDFTVGASVNARMRATSITGTPTYNLGISNGNVGGHFLRLETFQVSLVDINSNIRGTFALDGTVYHKYQLTVKNATAGNNATATWKVYVDGTLQITYVGAGTDNGFDGFMAGHAGTTATGTWWFDNISGRQDGEFSPTQWDPVY